MRGCYVARNLARHDVPLIAVLRDRWSPGGWSRLHDRTIVADTSTTDVIDALVTLGPELPKKAVLYPCFDTTVVLVARHREQLAQWYHIMQPDPSVIEMMVNKVAFYRYAVEADLPVPRTRFVEEPGDVERVIDDLQFPLLIKPPASKHPAWQARTRLKAMKADSEEDLRSLLAEYGPAIDGPMIVQEWVEGGDGDLFACHCCFARDGTLLASFTSRKVRQWPHHIGEVSLAEEVRCDEAREIAIDLFRTVGYRGIGYVEFKRDRRDGRLYLIEPNLRVSGRAGIAEAAGVELVYSMYCDAVGARLPDARTQRYVGAKWIFWRKDVQSAFGYLRAGQLTPREWLVSLRGIRAAGLFAWSDPGPFFGDLFRGIRLSMRRSQWFRGKL